MNIRKNFEAFFLAAVALGLSATYATAKVPAFLAAKATQVAPIESSATMHVVVVKAQRLSAEEKAAFN
jgi:hypothetical protein